MVTWLPELIVDDGRARQDPGPVTVIPTSRSAVVDRPVTMGGPVGEGAVAGDPGGTGAARTGSGTAHPVTWAIRSASSSEAQSASVDQDTDSTRRWRA